MVGSYGKKVLQEKQLLNGSIKFYKSKKMEVVTSIKTDLEVQ